MVDRVAIRIDVGSAAPLDVVTQLIQDVSMVCDVALALDRQSELNRATRLLPLDEPARIELIEYLRTRRYRPYDYPDDKQYGRFGRIQDILEHLFLSSAAYGPPSLWPPAEAQAAYLLDSLPDSGPLVPTVEQITYRNPLEIVLSGFTWGHLALSAATGGSLLALLNFVAYLGPKREKLKAEAEKARAEAGKFDAEAAEIRVRTNQARSEAELKAGLYRELLGLVRNGKLVLTPQQISDIVDEKAIGAIFELTQRPLEIEHLPDGKVS